MISIVVVSLNTAKKFHKTIQSILNQTTKNYELIIVDGRSIDETKKYIYKFKKKIDKVIIERDKGIYDAMNKGIRKASKEWIYFLNSGDIFFDNNTLKRIIIKLKKKKLIHAVVGNSYVKKGNFKYKSFRKEISHNSVSSSFSHQATFVKTKLMKKELFDLKYKYAADFHFFLKIYKKNYKINYIDNVISINLSDGISDTNKIKVFKEFREISLGLNDTFKKRILYYFIIVYFFSTNVIKRILPNKLVLYLTKIKNK
tara:strand:+ start:141 stop:911 length:771 start_codon:yes stop_codon:yes gene_type:complete